MGIRILHDARADEAALCCSTSCWAFGPVFSSNGYRSAQERAEAFMRWFDAHPMDRAWLFGRKDIRQLAENEVASVYGVWLAQEEEQYAREERDEKERLAAEEEADRIEWEASERRHAEFLSRRTA